MFVLVRAVTYATFFVGFLLIFVPSQLLGWSGIERPESVGIVQIVGLVIGVMGAVVGIWCIVSFAVLGKGTPAPFDPPRRLVVRGPYRWVRNPMYLGAVLALAGAALVYGSWPLLGYAVVFLLAAHGFVVGYEEPTLRRVFGDEYETYCRRVGRWWPGGGRSGRQEDGSEEG